MNYKISEISHDDYTVAVINSIESKYKALRQLSKAPTFLLTYAGTWRGLVQNVGFTEEEAKDIEAKYHELYEVSDNWVQSHITDASTTGHVTCAFGLRVRTPMIKKVIMGSSNMPYEASKEARTAGNALGQSWGLLNNRAAVELCRRLKASPYRKVILPVAHIHDSQYFIVLDDVDAVLWLNKNLIECMMWNDDPLIYHPDINLGGELSIFHPNWAHEIKVPNNITKEELVQLCLQYQ